MAIEDQLCPVTAAAVCVQVAPVSAEYHTVPELAYTTAAIRVPSEEHATPNQYRRLATLAQLAPKSEDTYT
jgi:hypothetical protein